MLRGLGGYVDVNKENEILCPVDDKEKIRQLESALVQSNAILDWIQGVLDEDDVSDFALSFPIVREVLDLKTLYIQLNSNEIE